MTFKPSWGQYMVPTYHLKNCQFSEFWSIWPIFWLNLPEKIGFVGTIYWVPEHLYDFRPSIYIQWQLLVICLKIRINLFLLTPPPTGSNPFSPIASIKCPYDANTV